MVGTTLFLALAFVLVALSQLACWYRLRTIFSRACTGRYWRRQFPKTPKADIRDFLRILTDSFGFRRKRGLCFRPDDRIMDVYTKIYPKWLPSADAMELETFIELIHERFGVDLLPTWNEEMTLGEVFQSTSHS